MAHCTTSSLRTISRQKNRLEKALTFSRTVPQSAILGFCTPKGASLPPCPPIPCLPSSLPSSPPRSNRLVSEVMQNRVEQFDISSPAERINATAVHFNIGTPAGNSGIPGAKKITLKDLLGNMDDHEEDFESSKKYNTDADRESGQCQETDVIAEVEQFCGSASSPQHGSLSSMKKKSQETTRYSKRLPAGAWLADHTVTRNVAVDAQKTKLTTTLLELEGFQVFEKMSSSLDASDGSTDAGMSEEGTDSSIDGTEELESACAVEDQSAVDLVDGLRKQAAMRFIAATRSGDLRSALHRSEMAPPVPEDMKCKMPPGTPSKISKIPIAPSSAPSPSFRRKYISPKRLSSK